MKEEENKSEKPDRTDYPRGKNSTGIVYNIYDATWLAGEYQSEFPISDERQIKRFENFLVAVESVLESDSKDKKQLLPVIASYARQLENYIAKLTIYQPILPSTDLQLESHPISFSLNVLEQNLEILRGLSESIKSDSTD